MSKVATAIIMLAVLVESVPGFYAKHAIDQGSVKANGGLPDKITKPGSYQLTGNPVVPAGVDGIDILSEDVTLDLNGGRGIVAENASVTGSTMTLNKGFGLEATCPSAILNNTIVANAGSIQTDQPGCVLENNGMRP